MRRFMSAKVPHVLKKVLSILPSLSSKIDIDFGTPKLNPPKPFNPLIKEPCFNIEGTHMGITDYRVRLADPRKIWTNPDKKQ